MHYVVSVLLLCLSVAMGFMQHYKSTAENKSKQLESISALHAQNMAMLSAYELQAAALNAKMNELNELAQSRQAQLDEALNHEQNQIWTSQRVPDGINRLFEARNATAGKGEIDLPANHGMQGNTNKNAN